MKIPGFWETGQRSRRGPSQREVLSSTAPGCHCQRTEATRHAAASRKEMACFFSLRDATRTKNPSPRLRHTRPPLFSLHASITRDRSLKKVQATNKCLCLSTTPSRQGGILNHGGCLTCPRISAITPSPFPFFKASPQSTPSSVCVTKCSTGGLSHTSVHIWWASGKRNDSSPGPTSGRQIASSTHPASSRPPACA
jgi:hypothetical protein